MDRLSEERIRGTLYKLEQSSSGLIYIKNDVIDMYKTISNINHVITDYAIELLSDTVVKAVFKSDYCGKKALRTSIWKFVDGVWKMSFHQGTVYKK